MFLKNGWSKKLERIQYFVQKYVDLRFQFLFFGKCGNI